MITMSSHPNETPVRETPLKIFNRFLRFGLLAWGGPVAQIAMIRQELVDEEKWVAPEEFNRALALYQVLPGPEAHELCVWFGMMRGGRLGGFLAGLGFMLPGFLLMLGLIWFYITVGIHSPVIQSIFFGCQAAVIALIFFGAYRIGKHVLLNRGLIAVALLTMIATFFGIKFFIVLPVTALAYILYIQKQFILSGLLLVLLLAFGLIAFEKNFSEKASVEQNIDLHNASTSHHEVFFSGLKAGLLTFGGAYTAIPFVQEDAVKKNHWMNDKQFLDGLALGGLIPAPLIIFTTFVGYFGSGWSGALLMTLGVFLPAFSFTLFGHHFLQRILEKKTLHNFFDGITAGVVGIIIVTAVQLFAGTITNIAAGLIFVIAIALLIAWRSKFASVIVIVGAGLMSLVYLLLI